MTSEYERTMRGIVRGARNLQQAVNELGAGMPQPNRKEPTVSNHTATAYLVISGKRGYGAPNRETGLRPITEVSIAALRKGRPRTLDPDEIVVKIRVQVPDDAFDPITPDALIVVPADLTLRGPIEVEATDANEEE
jgi:hypothetical protein